MKRYLFIVLLCGCSPVDMPAVDPGADGCTGGKCDSPSINACVADLVKKGESQTRAKRDCNLAMCDARRGLVIDSLQIAFTPDAVRWSCADVRGVNQVGRDDRGQEYCEYFAVVKLPTTGDAVSDAAPGVSHSLILGHQGGQLALALTAPQLDALDQLGSGEVGRCVFTSWHSDVAGPVPNCAGAACPHVIDEPVSTSQFRMTGSINSNNAARDLVEKCLGTPGDATIADNFMRGCMVAAQLFGTNWRKSDPSICAAVMRLAECGCTAEGVAPTPEAISAAVITAQPGTEGSGNKVTLRGFPLGGWSGLDHLPPGCEYVDIGNEANGQPSRTIVSCQLTASDVLKGAGDLKGSCREKYGENVVVHVPLPASALMCTPPPRATCSSQPWVIQ